ncbi:hypothetical protein [Neptunomonas japonica]|uniref:Peptidase S1 domain-containing protein n=1 Tax=Neptunomonas japonica JAMM 1380 TaxID=1441457 RepID=A0A7R6PJN7_9GAMM|nr:hypothetical protein [Neptunomonas japonica]BBB30366.1 conserved hypothetical protein [Neptunomonas japonica JAMM 1380]
MNWQDLIKYSSVQLRKHEDNDMPCGIGSGCLLDLKGQRFLLTVFHVTQNSSNWSAQIKYNEEVQKFEALFLNEFSYFADYSSDKTEIENVEFSFHPVRLDFTSSYQNINWKGEILESRERPIFAMDDISEPNKDIYYGFSGDILPTAIPDQNAFEATQHIYHGLKFDRVENDMLVFKLPEDHPGHKMFQGCSGAPIIGEDGKVVSLVSGGCTEKNEIYGCNLLKCIRSLDYYLQ